MCILKASHIHETTDLPDHLIAEVSGENIHKVESTHEGRQVAPICNFHVQAINDQSKEILETHKGMCTTSRLVYQHQELRKVPGRGGRHDQQERSCLGASHIPPFPVCEVAYNVKSSTHRLFVYGCNNAVWFDEYPVKCLCC